MTTDNAWSGLDWTRVDRAVGFWSRLRGLLATPGDRGLLIRGRSVHGFWLDRPLRVYGLDRGGAVLSVRVLRRRRVVVLPESTWMLEIPMDWPQLTVGTRVPLRKLPPR